ncbi:hypothetical protein GCM10025767_19710 [Thalassotalea piscium]
MISKDFADQKGGKISLVQKQHSEQENSRRELLAVEQEAKKDKIIEQYGKAHFKTQMMSKFFSQLLAKVNNEFDDKDSLYVNELRIDNTASTILEVLAVKSASINKITPLIQSLPWLSNELINLVNKPQYRKRSDIQVTESHLALSYIGLNNLKLVMPTFMLKHWLPINSAPYPLLKRKLWNYALSVGLSAQLLANKYELDEFSAFTAGLFANIGLIIVARRVLENYNEMHKDEVREAYDNRDKRLHDILAEFEMSPELLLEQLIERNTQMSADIVELMRFDRLAVTEPLFDLAIIDDIEKMHPIAQMVAKAKAYVMFRSLAKEELISSDEAKAILSAVKLSPDDITLLKSSDIDHIKLNFE